MEEESLSMRERGRERDPQENLVGKRLISYYLLQENGGLLDSGKLKTWCTRTW